jgi:hypothetical protein
MSKISLSKYGLKDMKLNFTLENSCLIAEGGANACLLRIQDIASDMEFNDKNEITKFPSHKCEFGIFAAECRLDSPGNPTPTLAFRFSNLCFKLNDTWESNSIISSTKDLK